MDTGEEPAWMPEALTVGGDLFDAMTADNRPMGFAVVALGSALGLLMGHRELDEHQATCVLRMTLDQVRMAVEAVANTPDEDFDPPPPPPLSSKVH